MLTSITTIIQKEIKDALRDPSSLFAAAIYTLMMPIMLLVILINMSNETTKIIDKEISLQGLEQESTVYSYLSDDGFTHKDDAAVRVIFPSTLDADLASGRQGKIIIEADLANSEDTVYALEAALMSLGNLMMEERLASRGIAPEYIVPLDIQVENSNKTTYITRSIVSLIVITLFLPIAFTGMSLSIDMTAGERERMTLEPLLAQPVSTTSIMIAKWITTFLLAMVGSAVTVTFVGIILNYIPIEDSGVGIHFTLVSALKIFIYVIPLTAIIAALQLALALYAKSYKEGITYLSVLGIVPLMVGFLNDEMLARLDFLPLAWEAGAIKKTLLGNSEIINLPYGALFISIVITTSCIFYAQWRLKQEALLT
jgi:sodium transport system permease protein